MCKWLASLILFAVVAVSPAQAKWREARSSHFVIYSQQGERDLKEFAEGLERFDKGMRLMLSVPDRQTSRAAQVTVFVLPGMDAVRRVYGGHAPGGLAGFYRPWTRGPVAFVPGTRDDAEFGKIVLQHEYAHHFLFQNFSAAFPAWFSEGFAEFAAASELQRDGSLSMGRAAQHRAYALLDDKPVDVQSLLEWKVSYRNAKDLDRYYGRAWLLCHYLRFDPARGGQLGAYLDRLNTGVPHVDAARAIFGDFTKLDKDLKVYLAQPTLKGFKFNPAQLTIAPIVVRELDAGEAAMMEVRLQSDSGVNKEEAPRVAEMARKAAIPYPSDPAVQIVLAEAEFDAGNFAEAIAAADRVLAANPKSLDALTYKGSAQMRLAEAAGKRDAATWDAIRKVLAAANRLDPDHPEPLNLFYRSFLSQGIEPNANALTGAVYALGLAPQDTGLRILVIQHLLRQNKVTEARPMLVRVAAMPHAGELRELAASMIETLDTQGAEAALRVMREKAPPQDSTAELGK